jgi:glycerophosphoryl diester phosphodiesterase
MIIIGHRGYPLRYPENTIASFLGAILHGAGVVELDVRGTMDNEVIVLHDEDTGRVAGEKIVAAGATYSGLSRLSLGMGQHIPLLRDVYRALPKEYLLFVEIKDPGVSEEAYRIADEEKGLERTVFISFHEEALRRVRSLDPEAKIGYSIMSLEAAQRAPILLRELRLFSVNPPIEGVKIVGFKDFKDYLVKIRGMGAKIALWTVDDPSLIKGLEDQIDYLITNDTPRFTGR